MGDSDINMERFAYDVCVHVLEKFSIFKAPDDTRKQNKYINYDFLPCVSRSVVSCAIWMRDNFKNALEDKYKTDDPSDKEKIWNFFDEYLLRSEKFNGKDCTRKVCASLALCTEYVQFVGTKGLTVSLNKLVIRWNDFFEQNLKENFEVEGGLLTLYSNLKSAQVDQLDNFHKSFISEYCLPYGARECTLEISTKCAEKHGLPLEAAIYGVEMIDIVEDISVGMPEGRSKTRSVEKSQSKKTRPDETASDSEGSGSGTDSSEKTSSEKSRNIGSEESDSETSHNNLLGIPPHEEMLREIDPFFVENIPSPPKPSTPIKLPVSEAASSNDPGSPSKSQEAEPGSTETLRASAPEELKEMVDQILSKLEHDMGALRSLLFENGLISMKSGRRGSGMRMKDSKDKRPPKGPEGLI